PPAEVYGELIALAQLYARPRLADGSADGLRGWESGLPRRAYFFFQLGLATEMAIFLCRDLESWTPASQVERIVDRLVAGFRSIAIDAADRLAAHSLRRALWARDRTPAPPL